MAMSENFGKRLMWIRIERGLKQYDLADKIGIDASLLSNYETGKVKPTITTLEWICQALDITASELLGF
jgi:transcriptional regulator with XRE-family HTH domain